MIYLVNTVLDLMGIALSDYHIDDNVLFVVLAFFILFCLGFVLNLFNTLMERCTARKGR